MENTQMRKLSWMGIILAKRWIWAHQCLNPLGWLLNASVVFWDADPIWPICAVKTVACFLIRFHAPIGCHPAKRADSAIIMALWHCSSEMKFLMVTCLSQLSLLRPWKCQIYDRPTSYDSYDRELPVTALHLLRLATSCGSWLLSPDNATCWRALRKWRCHCQMNIKPIVQIDCRLQSQYWLNCPLFIIHLWNLLCMLVTLTCAFMGNNKYFFHV